MTEIALTGSSGHLGLIIHKTLRRDATSHRVLLRTPVDYIADCEMIYGDLNDSEKRQELVQGCKTVIHCAGKVWPKTGRNAEVLHVNFNLTKRLFEDAAAAGVEHFIFISSIHSMIVPPVDLVFDESASLVISHKKVYDFSKAESERFLNDQKGMKITIMNPSAIIGTGDHYLRGLNQLFDRLQRGKLPAITSGGFSIVDARDVAQAIVNAHYESCTGKFLLSGKYFTMVELSKKYGLISGKKVPTRILSPGMMKFVARLSIPLEKMSSKPLALNTYAVETLLEGRQTVSANAARNALNFTSRPVEETLSDLHQWFTDQRLIL